VKARLTAWLSLLLLVTAVFGTPIARVDTNRVSCAAVYSEHNRERAEQHREVRACPRTAPPLLSAGSPRGRATPPFVDSRLFQRPPPSLLV
jgi:hypothetical protein